MIRYIANSKYSKVMSGFMAFLIFFNNVLFPTKAMALTGGASQPEFSSFDPAGASEMVNLFTGDFSYNIPLMDVDGYPVNIAYHASPGMEQEASWVGLGWNINAGAINRGMRGLPDDFNGDPVHRDLNIEPYKAWGVSIGYFGELAGLKIPISASGQGGVGVFHSNYTGFGIELSNSNTFGVSAGNKLQGGLTAGLGTRLNSQDGMDIYPQLGVTARMEKTKRTSSLGVNIGCAYNSREGIKSFHGGYSISTQKTQGKTSKSPDSQNTVSNSKGKGIGMSFGSSASVPASSQGFMPKAVANMSSQAYNLDFKLGANACVYAQGGYISGYYAQNGINKSQKSKDYATYGYLFSQNATNNDLLDFNREKDGMIYPELPNMPLANYTYDMFSASAQGLNYAFRPYRNDIGILRDNSTIDNSFGLGVGAELMVSSDINVGININVMFSNGDAGKWEDDNDFNLYSEFTNNDINSPLYEAAYLKVAGEKNDDDLSFLNSITNADDEAYRVKLAKRPGPLGAYYATNQLVNKYNSSTVSLSGGSAIKKNKRATRNELVNYLNAFEASKFGLDQKILDYPDLTASSLTPSNFDNVIIRTNNGGPENAGEFVDAGISKINRDGTFSGNRSHHISEMSVTQSNGSRYVYGIPMYNRKQMDAVFNVASEGVTNDNVGANGLIAYNAGTDDSDGNTAGIDHYMEKNTVPDYSHGFLLTSILSSDYVDRSGNGPSIDDYGDYTKFNYSRIGAEGAYKWRIPAESGAAKFSQGLVADKKDNKGVYVYGEKDLWYMQSIETKNYVALFILNDDRKDAYPVAAQSGGIASVNPSRSLKEIRLYAKKDFAHGGIDNAKPIKIVNFEYDYSLCPNTPNSTASTKGKLTLKKIWFTYGNSQKGKSSPYIFSYADTNHDGTPDSNPAYNNAAIDRWGNYKQNASGALNNLDFPYVVQSDPNLNRDAAAWSLTQIKTPAGSTIKVRYEADDYAYVQNKEAAQMFNVAALSASPAMPSGALNEIYGSGNSSPYIIVDLQPLGTKGILAGASASADFRTRCVKDLSRIYFRFKVNMDNKGAYEFVPGYAEMDDAGGGGAGVCADTYQVGGSGPSYCKYAFIKMKLFGINDKDQATPLVSPIAKAAFQMGRMYLPQVVFPGSQPASGNGSAIKGLVTTIKDSRFILKGVNKALHSRNIAKNFDLTSSVVRLYNSVGSKKGGGSRVSKITINDGWNAMSGEADAEYGQEYNYSIGTGSSAMSSGVASYEPLLGGDENAMRYPVDFPIKHHLAPNDEYFQEEPFGESFFPDPLVGYSKVTVRNIPKAGVASHATGRTEYEFFTAKDFPVVTDRTDLQKERVKPKLLQSILKFGSTDKLYLSQGYVIKTNDMHGRQRSEKIFAENGTSPISGVIYHYKTKAGTKSQELDNKVQVVDKNNTIADKTIGKSTDFYTDSRSAVNDSYTAGVSININSATCTYYVPLVFVWPSFGHEHREFKSLGTTKLIQQYGLIDYVEAFENNSTVKTKNLLYDDVSGEVLLTETVNDFDAPVYNFKYPAYWAYEDMGAAFANAGIYMNPTAINGSAMITASFKQYFRPGDEVGIFDNVGNAYTRLWVIEDKAGSGDYYLADVSGHVYSVPSNFYDQIMPVGLYKNRLKILRSGRRNLQSAPMQSLLSLKNPVMIGGAPVASGGSLAGGTLNATTATSVITSSAVEYSNEWHLLVGDKITKPDVCQCTANAKAFEMFGVTTALLQTLPILPSINPTASIPQPYLFGTNPVCNNSLWYPYALQYNNATIQNFITSNNFVVPIGCGPATTLMFKYMEGGVLPGANTNILQYKFGYYELPPCYLEIKLPAGYSWHNYSFVSIGNYQIYTSDCSRKKEFKADLVLKNLSTNRNVVFNSVECSTSCFNLCNESTSNVTIQCGRLLGDIVNPYVENIRGNWRVKKSYSYLQNRTQESQATPNMKGNIREDGVYTNFVPFWSRSAGAWKTINTIYGSYDKWVKNSEIEKINEYGNALYARDVLNRPSASLYGFNHNLPVATANNATYNQLAFDGFEDYDYIYNECSASFLGNVNSTNTSGYIEHFNYLPYTQQRSMAEAHTGRYSLNVRPNTTLSTARSLTNPSPTGSTDNVPYTIKEKDNYGTFGPLYNYNKAQTFVLSLWAREYYAPHLHGAMPILDYPDVGADVLLNGSSLISLSPKKTPIINGWQKLEYEFTVPANTPAMNGSVSSSITLTLKNAGSYQVFYDDVRIHPFNASMKSMVYDPYSLRLMAEHDDRNYATFYEYDEEGTLVRVKKETEKGIYTIKESRSGLKK